MRHALLFAVFFAALVVPALADAQKPDLRIAEGPWRVRCADGATESSCADHAPGELTLHVSTATSSRTSMHVTVAAPTRLRFGTWSREVVRNAGLVTLLASLGVGGSMVAGGTTSSNSVSWIALGISVAVLGLAVGPALMGVHDQPVLDVGGRYRIRPDLPEVRLATELGLEALLVLGAIGVKIATVDAGNDTALIGALSLALLATPAVVTLAGALGDAHGNLGWATLGFLAGVAPAALLWLGPLISGTSDSSAPLGALSTGLVLGLLGSIVAYEVSSGDERRAIERGEVEAEKTGPTVMPSFAVIPGGAELGVVGTL